MYPFSQRKQVVTDSNTPEDQESTALLATGTRPSWADLSVNDQDGYPDGDKRPVEKVASDSQCSVPSSPPSYPLFDRVVITSVEWEWRESVAKPILVAAFTHIGYVDPAGTADALLQESWNDILSVVKTKHTLTAWVHKLRSKNPRSRVLKSSSAAQASGNSAPVVQPLQLPPQVVIGALGSRSSNFRCMPSVATWCMPHNVTMRQHHYIGSPRSPGPSKPNSFEDPYDALGKCNQTESSAADGEIFLTPKSGSEEPSASTTAAQDSVAKSVQFNHDAASQTGRARPGEWARSRRSPPQRPPRQFAPRHSGLLRNSTFVRA